MQVFKIWKLQYDCTVPFHTKYIDFIKIKTFKVSGPFVETLCVFQCIKNIINAEMWA